MKIRPTRKVVFIGVAYLVLCGIFVFLGDWVFAVECPFFSNMVAGLLTIVGGFLLAYWLIERNRLSKEEERRKRVIRVLRTLKNFLLPWLYHYAAGLSARPELYLESDNKIGTGKYIDDIPQLEDSFTKKEFSKIPLGVDNLYDSLNWGLREMERIEGLIKEFPTVLAEIHPEVAKIVHISEYIRARIAELQEWDKKHGKDTDHIIGELNSTNAAIRGNLRILGDSALKIVKAIDANLKKLEAEL